MKKARVVVGMSGGVDSSVAALLLQRDGYEVIGITLKMWPQDCLSLIADKCCGPQAISDARGVANKLGIPHYVIDETQEFEKKVINYFTSEYQAGRTVLLRYDPENDMIVFDHLSPPNPELEGQFQFYGPDFTFDGLRFKDGKWEYVKNVDVRNPKDKTDKLFNPPK